MEENQLPLQAQKELNRLILEDKTLNLLNVAVGKVLAKAKIKGVKDGVIVYDDESVSLINFHRSQIEERMGVIKSFFNSREINGANGKITHARSNTLHKRKNQ